MNSIFLQITAAISLLTLLVTATRQFHIFQLNSYFPSRFWDYLKQNFKGVAKASAVVFVIEAVLIYFSPLAALIFTVITGAVRAVYAIIKTKSAKKKIVFTGRVKRMYATMLVLSLAVVLIFSLADFSEFSLKIYAAVCALVMALSPFAVMLSNLINSPIEWSFRQWYIGDAKRILKSMPNLKIIGVTGSYGKTSTKYALARVLSEKYNVVITPGSFNTLLGVVRTIREHLTRDAEVFIVEMGAKRKGDIKEICDLVHPKMGIITSIGPQHLNTFGSIETVASTKFELADAVKEQNGIMFLNTDNEYIKEKTNAYNHVAYGISSGEIRAEKIQTDRHGCKFDIVFKNKKIPVQTKLLGKHNVLNIISAVAAAIELGISENDIKYAVSRLEAVEHRLQMKPLFSGSLLIDDAYNANPEGSLEALRVLGGFAPMKRIVVTPGLVELGNREEECNTALGRACAENCDEIYFVGLERSKPLKKGATDFGFDEDKIHVVKTFNDALSDLRSKADNNTVVLFENDLPDNYEK
jgi:UDP-N-acetylmuramoyl-tripeptide--D-alanyl-D-alanine ligase